MADTIQFSGCPMEDEHINLINETDVNVLIRDRWNNSRAIMEADEAVIFVSDEITTYFLNKMAEMNE